MSAMGTLDIPIITPTETVDAPLYEIVNGQRVELPSSGAYATWIAFRLTSFLGSFVGPRKLGTVVMEMLFILDNVTNTRRRPDVAFVSAGKWPPDQAPPETGDWDIVPDLAIEVVSPHDALQEVFKKMEQYFRFGVTQVWIVIPSQRQIYMYDSPTNPIVISAGKELDGGTLLPGLRLPVASLFSRRPEGS